MRKLGFIGIFFIGFICIMTLFLKQASTETAVNQQLFISPTGDDIRGDGSLNAPLASLAAAAERAEPGTTIFVRGGTYLIKQEQVIQARGTAVSPILIRPYQNEMAHFTGRGTPFSPEQSLIRIGHSRHLTFTGFEISHSTGRGVSVRESTNITVSHLLIHDIAYRALGGGGERLTFTHNELFHSARINAHPLPSVTGGWPGVLQTYRRADGTPSQDITIAHNYIHNNWGEGIIVNFAEQVSVTNNVLHDNFSGNIYIDTSRHVQIKENNISASSDRYNRSDTGLPPFGIGLATEYYWNEPQLPVTHITIENNQIEGVGKGIRYWHDVRNQEAFNTYSHIIIRQNEIRNTVGTPIDFDSVPEQWATPQASELSANQISPGRSGTLIEVGNQSGWHIVNNWLIAPDAVTLLPLQPLFTEGGS